MLYYDYMEEQHHKSKIKKILKWVGIVTLSVLVLCGSFGITYFALIKNYNNNKVSSLQSNTDNSNENNNTIDNNVSDNNNTNEINNNTNSINQIHQISKYPLPKVDETTQDRVIDIYYSDEKQVFLTFDDGPSQTVTPTILDILKQNNVKATFFTLGSRAELNPDILKRAYDEGHYIANHGYSHVYSSIYADPQNVLDEYNKTEQIIKEAIKNPDYNSYFFRFPGGSSGGPYDDIKIQAKQLLAENNIVFTNWNCLTGDAAGKTSKEEMMQELIETIGEQKSLIVLMHDAGDKQETANLLPEIIQYFKENGYVFKNFYDIMK